MIWHLAAGTAAAACLLVAWRRSWLDRDGLASAVLVGAGVWAGAGPGGVGLLLLFFLSSALLTAGRGGPGASPRTARQVWANGGPAALCGAAGAAGWLPGAAWAVAGAVAAATADTWATEAGRWRGGPTRHLLLGGPVPPGTPGGVSAAGTAAALAGASAVGAAAAAVLPGSPARALGASLAAGAGAALLDSALHALPGVVGRDAPPGWWGDAVNAAATGVGAAVGWAVAAGA